MSAQQIAFALSRPVFDPTKHIIRGHNWMADKFVSACLTVNIGME